LAITPFPPFHSTSNTKDAIPHIPVGSTVIERHSL